MSPAHAREVFVVPGHGVAEILREDAEVRRPEVVQLLPRGHDAARIAHVVDDVGVRNGGEEVVQRIDRIPDRLQHPDRMQRAERAQDREAAPPVLRRSGERQTRREWLHLRHVRCLPHERVPQQPAGQRVDVTLQNRIQYT